MRHRFGIRKKIMLTMAFMTIIPVLVMGIVSTAQSRNIIKEQTNTLARKNLIITAQEINEKVDLLYATIQELPTNTVVLSGLRRLPDTSEAHLSYQEQLETELYSARNLLRLKMPSSYALVFPDGPCYSTYLAPGGDGRNRLDAYAWYQALSSSNYSRVWYGVSDDLFNLLGGRSLYVAGNLVVDGQTAAVALLGISTTQMERLLCSSRITTNSLVFLSSSTGDYVISSEGVPPEPGASCAAERRNRPAGTSARTGFLHADRVSGKSGQMDADNDRAGYRPVSFGLFAFMADGSADFGSLHVHCRHDALYQSLADFPRHSAQRQHESGAARRSFRACAAGIGR